MLASVSEWLCCLLLCECIGVCVEEEGCDVSIC